MAVVFFATLSPLGFLPRVSAHGAVMSTQLTPDGARAYEVLALADRFAYGTAGDGGVSEEACAVQALLRESRGEQGFQRLLEEPAVVAKLYGLVGVWHRNPASFASSVAALDRAHGDDVAATISGCAVNRRTVREILYAKGAIAIPAGTRITSVVWPDEVRKDLAGGSVALELAHTWGCAAANE